MSCEGDVFVFWDIYLHFFIKCEGFTEMMLLNTLSPLEDADIIQSQDCEILLKLSLYPFRMIFYK